MGCLKLTYQSDFLFVRKEAAREKSDPYFFIAQGKKEARQEKSDNYYPFGLQTANTWTRENVTGNNFLANGGTELNDSTGLYDLEFRNYDAVLGRMNQVDPMAHSLSSFTPYNYSFNNPVSFNDPNGASPVIMNGQLMNPRNVQTGAEQWEGSDLQYGSFADAIDQFNRTGTSAAGISIGGMGCPEERKSGRFPAGENGPGPRWRTRPSRAGAAPFPRNRKRG